MIKVYQLSGQWTIGPLVETRGNQSNECSVMSFMGTSLEPHFLDNSVH